MNSHCQYFKKSKTKIILWISPKLHTVFLSLSGSFLFQTETRQMGRFGLATRLAAGVLKGPTIHPMNSSLQILIKWITKRKGAKDT